MFWAVTNSRYFDIVLGLAILGTFAFWLFAEQRRRFVGRFLFGMAMAVFILVWMHEVMKWLLDHGRMSPTLVLPDAVRIGNAFDFIPKVKDSSHDSFPGDHFGVALMIGLILCHVAGWRIGGTLLLIAMLSALPRLAGGGHWFTDQVVGGGFAGLLGAAVFLAPVWWWRGRAPRHQQ
jgi:membrane-associated phospholipid phosphatase